MMTFEKPWNAIGGWSALKDAAVSRGARVLPRGGLMRGVLPRGGMIRCEEGIVWVTVDGAREDVVLAAGEAQRLSGFVRFLVEALEDARIRAEN